jgi:glutaredoxin
VEDRKFICPCYRHEKDIVETGHCICHLFVSDEYQPMEVDPPPIWRGDGLWPHVVLYGTYWCQDTTRSRNYLSRHGIPYTFVDIEADSDAAQRVMDWNGGYLSTPTLDIEGRIITEPSDEELAELVKVEG